jgi:hypothetical protein
MDTETKKKNFSRAGHYEIQGETIAKFEFFDNGFNPYSRYLDIDKIDLLLRKRVNKKIKYIEVQVKYGKLFNCGGKWEKKLFDYTSWRFFKHDEFKNTHDNLYLAYILSRDDGYKGDMFIFPIKKFNALINQGITRNTKKGKQHATYIAHSIHDDNWYLWKKTGFEKIDKENTVNVTKYRRNFNFE